MDNNESQIERLDYLEDELINMCRNLCEITSKSLKTGGRSLDEDLKTSFSRNIGSIAYIINCMCEIGDVDEDVFNDAQLAMENKILGEAKHQGWLQDFIDSLETDDDDQKVIHDSLEEFFKSLGD